ncbi:hypothetical protein N2152v2_002830 [Parachlorella kessleri]
MDSANPQALAWLASLPTRVLRIGSFLLSTHSGRLQLLRQRRSSSAPTLAAAGAAAPYLAAVKGREATLQELTVMEMLEALGFISCGKPPAAAMAVTMAAFSQLQVLHLKGALSPSGEPCSLDTAPLAALGRLDYVHLERFTHYCLGGLPSSVRKLRLRYQETPTFSSQKHPALDVLRLPCHARLALLDLDSRASLGLVGAELLYQCEEVTVRATRAYLAVHGLDLPEAELLAGFHSPAVGLRQKRGLMEDSAEYFSRQLSGHCRDEGTGSSHNGGAGGNSNSYRWNSNGGRELTACTGAGSGQAAVPQWVQPAMLQSLEFRWMCADRLVFVPLPQQQQQQNPGAAAGQACPQQLFHSRESRWTGAAEAALESAYAAVHEGEDPVVELTAARVADLVARVGCGAVYAVYAVGQQHDMLLRLVAHR